MYMYPQVQKGLCWAQLISVPLLRPVVPPTLLRIVWCPAHGRLPFTVQFTVTHQTLATYYVLSRHVNLESTLVRTAYSSHALLFPVPKRSQDRDDCQKFVFGDQAVSRLSSYFTAFESVTVGVFHVLILTQQLSLGVFPSPKD